MDTKSLSIRSRYTAAWCGIIANLLSSSEPFLDTDRFSLLLGPHLLLFAYRLREVSKLMSYHLMGDVIFFEDVHGRPMRLPFAYFQHQEVSEVVILQSPCSIRRKYLD